MAESHSIQPAQKRNRNRRPAIIRFLEKIEVSETQFFEGTPCWIWQGTIHPVTGYGQFKSDGRRGAKTSSPHIFSHEFFIGLIPEGEEVDHRCHVRSCASPFHLRTLTHAKNQNARRNCYAVSGSCKNGHEISGENVRVDKKTGRLICKACQRECARRFHARNPEANRTACLKYQAKRKDRAASASS